MFKNLLFDLDGTLADPLSSIAGSLSYAFQKYNLQPPSLDVVRTCIGPPLEESLLRLLGPHNEFLAADVLAAYRHDQMQRGIYLYQFFPEILALLPSLKKDFRLFVATSKPHASAIPILKHFEVAPYFEKIYGSELDGVRVHKTDLLKYILSEEKLNPTETLMIGDRMHDVIGAKNNHVKCAGVLWGFGSQDELTKAGASFICEDAKSLERVCRAGI